MNQPLDNLTGHNYDGIQEYDNPTPGWWNWIFFLSFVYAIIYFVYYHIGVGEGIHEQYKAEFAANIQLQFASMGELKPDEPTLLANMGMSDRMAFAERVFAANCIACHAADGSGMIGPNLTDDLYRNVKVVTDIIKIVAEGAGNGAMPPWKAKLHPNEVVLVSAYVASMRGKNLTSKFPAILPPGDKIAPWPAAPAR